MNSQRFTYEYVSNYFQSQGCKLLETEYKNARTKMRYICVCGNESQIVFYSFKQGCRCRKCGAKKNAKKLTLTQEQVKNKFEEIGCDLVGEYKKANIKCKIKCYCGEIVESTPNNFWKAKKCKHCALKSRSGSNHYMWQEDREKFEFKYKIKQKCYKMVSISLKATGKIKDRNTKKLLGYTYCDLKEHITSHPNWNDLQDKDWHLDHIFPIKAFMDYKIFDLQIINALDNLRPLEAKANMQKQGKYSKKEFETYLKLKGLL